MYLARFEASNEEWVQAAALIVPRGSSRESKSGQWELVGRQLSAASQIPRATVTHRIAMEPARELRHTIALTAPVEHERLVREIIARLTRIEAARGGSLALPGDRNERDQWFEQLAELRWCTSAETFSVGSLPVACDFRIAKVLDDLMVDACVGGYGLTYQLHVRAADVSPEWVRAARKSMLALSDIRGIRSTLLVRQEELARNLGDATALCEEYLAVDSSVAARAVEALLADRFRAEYGPLGFPPSGFHFERGAYEDALVTGLHSHDLDPLPPVALCGIAASGDERDRLLSWAPSPRLRDLLGMAAAEPSAASDRGETAPVLADIEDCPRPYEGEGAFAFASYKRQDLTRIAPILRRVQELGIPVWYDRAIPGGAEWDEVIEDRVSRSRFVIVFASSAALESKYVRREVKFADALDVPILPIALEDAALTHGMRMLLTQYQILDARRDDFSARLQTAITHLW